MVEIKMTMMMITQTQETGTSPYEQCWRYRGKCLYEPPEGYFGFIYQITDDVGRIYIGKKFFTHSKTRKLTKKERVGTRKRIEKVFFDSDWLDYWSSCKPLLE